MSDHQHSSEPSCMRTAAPSAASSSSAQHQQPAAAAIPNLPDILGQLRLVPNQPLIKLPADDYPNPFQLPPIASAMPQLPQSRCLETSASGSRSSQTRGLHEQLFGPKCDCNFSPATSSPTPASSSLTSSGRKSHHSKSNEHSILHPKLFKHKAISDASSAAFTNGTRIVLRQPQLRLLEQCLQHGLTRSCASLPDQRPESPVQQRLPQQQQLHQSNLPSNLQSPVRSATGASNWPLRASRGLADYPSLVKDCAKLSLSVGSGLPSSSSAEHSSRAFRHIQQPHNHLHPNHHHPSNSSSSSSGSRLAARLKVGGAQRNAAGSLRRPRSRSEDRVYGGLAASAASAASARPSRTPTTTASSSASAASTSLATCSQQAAAARTAPTGAASGGSSPADCDVTIDELASYFETFVHIPKKMSTMAEMMYI